MIGFVGLDIFTPSPSERVGVRSLSEPGFCKIKGFKGSKIVLPPSPREEGLRVMRKCKY